MKRKHFRPRKSLGQNFLYDPAIAGRIAAATGLGDGDVAVELGAGRGILTEALSKRGARVVAVELDRALGEELDARYADNDRVEIVHADFTTLKLRDLLRERSLDRCTLVGNIPYHLTRDVLFGYLVDEHEACDAGVIMVQKEVGERILSPPGSRVYGVTSVVLQALYKTSNVMRVSPGSFAPRPKVASVVLRFEPLAEPALRPGELEGLRGLVRNLFGQRRKTILNSLKSSYDLGDETLRRVAVESGIDPAQRPEQLGTEEFITLARALAAAIDK